MFLVEKRAPLSMELEGVSAADPKIGCDFSMGFRPLGISVNRP